MQISIKSLQKREDPYQLFLDSLTNEETKRKYTNWLYRFLKVIPDELYQGSGQTPMCQDVGTLARCFVSLAKKDPDMAKNIIAEFIKEEKKLVTENKLNPNTIPNHIKPIKSLLDANSIPIHWKSLHKMYPREQQSNDRAYTKEELQKMIEVCSDITDKMIIQLFSSGGFRLGAWEYFTWKDVIFFKNSDGSYKGAALLVYKGDPESYWTFITPEACKTLELYRESWKSQIGKYPSPDDPLVKSIKYYGIKKLNMKGVRRRVDKIVTKIGLRPPLPPGKKRHEVALDHGFRKYFNTMMRRAKVDYLDKASDGTTAIVNTTAPISGQPLVLGIEFKDSSGNFVKHQNYAITVTQDNAVVLSIPNGHTHTGTDTQTTMALSSADKISIQITLLGVGLPTADPATWTGAKGEVLDFSQAGQTTPPSPEDYKIISGVGKDAGNGMTTYDVQYSSVKNIVSSSVSTKDKLVNFVLIGNTDTNSTLILKLPIGLISGPFIGVFEDGQIITNYTTTNGDGYTTISMPIDPLTESISIVGTSVLNTSIPVPIPTPPSTTTTQIPIPIPPTSANEIGIAQGAGFDMGHPEFDKEHGIAQGPASGGSSAACVDTNTCFYPNPLYVTIGTTVTWRNTDTGTHMITSGKPDDHATGTVLFYSGFVKPGKTFQFTFTNSGTYDYFDQIYPWMTGQVIVGQGSQSIPSSQPTYVFTPTQQDIQNINQAKTNQTIAAEVNIGDNQSTTTIDNNVSVQTTQNTPDSLNVNVSASSQTGPKVIAFNLNATTINVANLKDLGVMYDGKLIQPAPNMDAILHAKPTDSPSFAIVVTQSGVQVLVLVPHFSTHSITIMNMSKVMTTTIPEFGSVVGVIITISIIGSMALSRRFLLNPKLIQNK